MSSSAPQRVLVGLVLGIRTARTNSTADHPLLVASLRGRGLLVRPRATRMAAACPVPVSPVGVWFLHSDCHVALPFVSTMFCMLTLSLPLAFASSNYLVIELLINYLSRVLESPLITDSSTLHPREEKCNGIASQWSMVQ
jgi:hypothetical protein